MKPRRTRRALVLALIAPAAATILATTGCGAPRYEYPHNLTSSQRTLIMMRTDPIIVAAIRAGWLPDRVLPPSEGRDWSLTFTHCLNGKMETCRRRAGSFNEPSVYRPLTGAPRNPGNPQFHGNGTLVAVAVDEYSCDNINAVTITGLQALPDAFQRQAPRGQTEAEGQFTVVADETKWRCTYLN